MNTIGAFTEREGSACIVHTYPVQFNTTGIASGVRVDQIKASATAPVQVEVSCQVITAFNAVTTNVLTMGTDTTANQWLSAANITEGTPGFYPASNAVAKFRLTADTDVYAKYTQSGTAATTGSAVFIVKEWSESVSPIV